MLFITLLKGFAVGIVIALPVGPVGVLCVRRSLFEGAWFGLVSGLGAALGDTMLASIAAFGLTFIQDWLIREQDWFGILGGVFLLGFGAKAFFLYRMRDPEPLAGEALLGTFASAFALTVINPVTLLSLAAILAKVGAEDVTGFRGVATLVAGVFAGSAAWWLGLSFGTGAFRRFAGHTVMRWLNRISGVILIASGAALLFVALSALAR